jgi:heme/copper-type cytochrome/quinol oxidase subunit 2
MFIPALSNSAAHAVTVLTSISNAGSGAGFRANVGAFNPEDSAVTATFRIFDGGVQVGDSLVRNLPAHAGTQINNVFGAAGAGSQATTNAIVVVEATGEIFTYAAVIDNATTDPIFVVGAEDAVPEPGFTPAATATPPGATPTPTPTRTPTPTPTSPAATVVNLVATQFQWSFNGGSSSFVMRVGQTYELRISDGDPPGTEAHGFSGIPGLGVSGAALTAGGPATVRMVTPNSGDIGPNFFSCNRTTCGTGHDSMIGSVEVQP